MPPRSTSPATPTPCSKPTADGHVALIQRDVCAFTTKGESAIPKGYVRMVVYNDVARGDALLTVGGDPVDIPGVFIGHSDGLAIAGVEAAADLVIGRMRVR